MNLICTTPRITYESTPRNKNKRKIPIMVLFMSQYRIILLHNDALEKKLVDPPETHNYIIVRDT